MFAMIGIVLKELGKHVGVESTEFREVQHSWFVEEDWKRARINALAKEDNRAAGNYDLSQPSLLQSFAESCLHELLTHAAFLSLLCICHLIQCGHDLSASLLHTDLFLRCARSVV